MKAIVYKIINKSNKKAFVSVSKKDNLDSILNQKINKYLNKVEKAKKINKEFKPDGKLEEGFHNEGPIENFIIEKIDECDYSNDDELREKMWNFINQSGYIQTGYNEPKREYSLETKPPEKEIKLYKITSKANKDFIIYDLSKDSQEVYLTKHVGKNTDLGKEMRMNTKDVIQIELIQKFPLEEKEKANEELKKLKTEQPVQANTIIELEKIISETEGMFNNLLNNIISQIRKN